MQIKDKWREILIRVVILLVGLTIAHFGVTLFLLADLGSDPFNVLVQGIFRTVSGLTGWIVLTHGYTHIAICFLIIVVLLIADKSYIKIGTLLCMIFGGPIIDFFSWMLDPVFTEDMHLAAKLIALCLGCAILALGMTIVIKSEAGTGPNDLVAVVISDKTGKKFGLVRIIVDITFLAVGFVLGGAVGIGTIICACFVGPVAGFFMPYSEKMVHMVLNKVCGTEE